MTLKRDMDPKAIISPRGIAPRSVKKNRFKFCPKASRSCRVMVLKDIVFLLPQRALCGFYKILIH